MEKNIAKVSFLETEVINQDGIQSFVWPISDDTKAKIRDILEAPDLEFGFNNTLEKVPRFSCPECGEEITFFHHVAAGLKASGPHSKQRFRALFQKTKILSDGRDHHISCSSGHPQPIVMGWSTGSSFDWTYN
jgi:hypothetical protein